MLNKILLVLCLLLLLPVTVLSAVTLPWSTTFDCPDWSDGSAYDCNGITQSGQWDLNGVYEQVDVLGNNQTGGGFKGQRHWVGDGQSGSNTGGMAVTLDGNPSEIWVRFYMRFPAGFVWSAPYQYQPHFYKIMLIYSATSTSKRQFTLTDDGMSIAGQDAPVPVSPDGIGWDTVQVAGGQDGSGAWQGDGQFHCYEVRMKMDTGSVDGEFDVWIDGELKWSTVDAEFNNDTGFSSLVFGSNAEEPDNGADVAIDYDDISISSTGYIGPIDDVPVNGVCVDGQTLSATPTNLCVAGIGSAISGTGPWTWGCAGANGGTDTAINACSAAYQAAGVLEIIQSAFGQMMQRSAGSGSVQ